MLLVVCSCCYSSLAYIVTYLHADAQSTSVQPAQTFPCCVWSLMDLPGQLCLAVAGCIALRSEANSSASLITTGISPLSFPKVKGKLRFIVITPHRNAQRDEFLAALRWNQTLNAIKLPYICQDKDKIVYMQILTHYLLVLLSYELGRTSGLGLQMMHRQCQGHCSCARKLVGLCPTVKVTNVSHCNDFSFLSLM